MSLKTLHSEDIFPCGKKLPKNVKTFLTFKICVKLLRLKDKKYSKNLVLHPRSTR